MESHFRTAECRQEKWSIRDTYGLLQRIKAHEGSGGRKRTVSNLETFPIRSRRFGSKNTGEPYLLILFLQ